MEQRARQRLWSRRGFLALAAAVPSSAWAQSRGAPPRDTARAVRRDGSPALPAGFRSLGARLSHLRDPRRHFIFEYYPWYEGPPWPHWGENLRTPPVDIASFALPALGPYDSREISTIEQHARWIAESGVGAINISWWGREDPIDQRIHPIMDVMRAHDIRVTFHIEPYADDRASRYRSDVLYLLREYGERRRWDTLLLLSRGRAGASPVFKSFRTILPETSTDCLGVTRPISDYTPDGDWRRATDGLRADLRADFAGPLLLCDSLDAGRVAAAGFDGLAVYDPFVRPATWASVAEAFAARGLVSTFNINVGFDRYPVRGVESDPCFVPSQFEPFVGSLDWTIPEARTAAEAAGWQRLLETTGRSLQLQTDPRLANLNRGVFVTYINSFNEWHEGTAFEPARDLADLLPDERAVGYHNPVNGRWRLDGLRAVLDEIYAGASG